MPAISKNLTERTSLRFTSEEDTIISNVVRDYAEAGITISRNDAIRVAIRRAGTPLPTDDGGAWDLVITHARSCPHCTVDAPTCPEGRWYGSLYDRLFLSPTTQRTSTSIPKAPPEQPQGPSRRPVVRRRSIVPGLPVLPAPGTKAG